MLRIFCFLFMTVFLASCTLCRYDVLVQADDAKNKGYQTRVVTYEMGFVGKAWGGFVWSHHAELQVLDNGEWRFYKNGYLSDSPDFSVKGMLVVWEPDQFSLACKVDTPW